MQTPMRKYRILAQQSRRCHIYLHVKKKYPDKRVLVGVKTSARAGHCGSRHNLGLSAGADLRDL